ncbi:MAG: nicotinate-mononucleotide adenylyltransferase [Sodalis sp. Psp]|nr:nicotinate-mononucleotide adenylyltransferase [Sodalis sp. Psp]MCR3757091.1 nicotinate-mononucleotide adenylyltransferase [Sodalis sp. Ppy]
MSECTLIAFYGGTFDPIHYGHLKSVIALTRLVNLKQIILMPNNVPPHRPQPIASSQQRVEMVRLAIVGMARNLFTIDERELHRETPSWTVETFEALRREYGPSAPMGFIIGQDSLLTLPQWHRGQELLELCHLLVCARPGYSDRLTNRSIDDPKTLHQKPAGLIYCASTPEFAISASDIRQRYKKGQLCKGLLPSSVQSYIDKQGLYR